jgi:hypothetical protein
MDSQVFAFRVWVDGYDHSSIVNHLSSGKAKAEYYRDLRDVRPDIPFTAIRAKKLGAPVSSTSFVRNAQYRGMPQLQCGDRVKVGDAQGVIVGHSSSANFNVLFDQDSRYQGQVLNVHPQEIEVIKRYIEKKGKE